MKIPKYVKVALQKQAKYSKLANTNNNIIHDWLLKQGVELSTMDIYSRNSFMIITEPEVYSDGLRNIIEEISHE